MRQWKSTSWWLLPTIYCRAFIEALLRSIDSAQARLNVPSISSNVPLYSTLLLLSWKQTKYCHPRELGFHLNLLQRLLALKLSSSTFTTLLSCPLLSSCIVSETKINVEPRRRANYLRTMSSSPKQQLDAQCRYPNVRYSYHRPRP
jgi:hypothetical protein